MPSSPGDERCTAFGLTSRIFTLNACVRISSSGEAAQHPALVSPDSGASDLAGCHPVRARRHAVGDLADGTAIRLAARLSRLLELHRVAVSGRRRRCSHLAHGPGVRTSGAGTERVQLDWSPKIFFKRGPYEFSRHPMYLAELALWLGWAIFYGSLGVLAGFAVFAIVVSRLGPIEERALEARFGEEYRAYAKDVPRWLRIVAIVRCGTLRARANTGIEPNGVSPARGEREPSSPKFPVTDEDRLKPQCDVPNRASLISFASSWTGRSMKSPAAWPSGQRWPRRRLTSARHDRRPQPTSSLKSLTTSTAAIQLSIWRPRHFGARLRSSWWGAWGRVRREESTGAEPLHYAADANRWHPTAQAETIDILSIGADPNAVDGSGVLPAQGRANTLAAGRKSARGWRRESAAKQQEWVDAPAPCCSNHGARRQRF